MPHAQLARVRREKRIARLRAKLDKVARATAHAEHTPAAEQLTRQDVKYLHDYFDAGGFVW
ncbi:MAG: hypothetical protein EPN91_08815 [Salinibacterium sp.]|nr:MAG: hypothetical protein EPN91_08815 [Salinibacterium sp.]